MEKAIKRAIEGAIEGGWNPRPEKVEPQIVMIQDTEYDGFAVLFETSFIDKKGMKNGRNWSLLLSSILMDISFWRALGKAEGWELARFESDNGNIYAQTHEYEIHMHRFIDHLIEGKPIDEFFNKLIN